MRRLIVMALFASAAFTAAAQESSLDELEKQLQSRKTEEARRADAERKRRADAERQSREAAERAKQAELQRSDPAQIRLESGITLADWVLLAELRVQKGECAQVLPELAVYQATYPRVTVLQPMTSRCLTEKVESIAIYDAQGAAAALSEIEMLLSRFPNQAGLHVHAGKAKHILGQFDAAKEHYSKALSLLPNGANERTEVLEWFQKALSREVISLAIAPIVERPLPQLYEQNSDSVEAALRCWGPVRSGIDYEMITEGTWAKDSIAGKPLRSVTTMLSLRAGLSQNKPTFEETDFSRDWTQMSAGFAYWLVSEGRWTSGSLAGGRQSSIVRPLSVTCDQPMLPLQPGKKSTVVVRSEHRDQTSGTGSADSSTRTVIETTTQVETLGPPLSVDAALQRHPYLRLSGRTSNKWIVHEVRSTTTMRYVELDVAPEARQYYKDTSNTYTMLFVEGPNAFVADVWKDSLQSGWTTTIRELTP